MAIMEPVAIPEGREHLDDGERTRLDQFEMAVDRSDYETAQEIAEDLWRGAVDAHRELYRGITNAVTAVCAHSQGKHRGAAQIAGGARRLLAPYPRRVLGLDLDGMLASLDRHLEGNGSGLSLFGQDSTKE